MKKDPEMLAIERINKILEALPDRASRFRVMDYCAKRAFANTVNVSPEAEPSILKEG